MLSARLFHSVKLIHIKNYECEAHSHLSYYCEAHSQLHYGCEAHSHLSYYCEAHSSLCYECEAHSHLSYYCEVHSRLRVISHEFGVVQLFLTCSNCSTTHGSRPAMVFHMSSGLFNPIEPLSSKGNKDHRIISHEFGVGQLF